jgi:CheY-like chemotaxis protein
MQVSLSCEQLQTAADCEAAGVDSLANAAGLRPFDLGSHPVAVGSQATECRSILIFDNLSRVCNMAGFLLKKLGYEVDYVDNAGSALEKVSSKLYTLVLIELSQAGKSTPELIAGLKERHSNTAVIGMGFRQNGNELDYCLSCGMLDYVNTSNLAANLTLALERLKAASLPAVGKQAPEIMPVQDIVQSCAPADYSISEHLSGFCESQKVVFHDSLKTIVSCLKLALEEKSTGSLVLFSDSLKGLNSSLKIPGLEALADSAANKALSGDWTETLKHLNNLESICLQVIEYLQSCIHPDSFTM